MRGQTVRSIAVAAQDGGAVRWLTTSAARRQSSSKASAANGSATIVPSASRATQPIASQTAPSRSDGSFGVRTSASAASHSRTGKVSPLAVRITDNARRAAHRDDVAAVPDVNVRHRRAERP